MEKERKDILQVLKYLHNRIASTKPHCLCGFHFFTDWEQLLNFTAKTLEPNTDPLSSEGRLLLCSIIETLCKLRQPGKDLSSRKTACQFANQFTDNLVHRNNIHQLLVDLLSSNILYNKPYLQFAARKALVALMFDLATSSCPLASRRWKNILDSAFESAIGEGHLGFVEFLTDVLVECGHNDESAHPLEALQEEENPCKNAIVLDQLCTTGRETLKEEFQQILEQHATLIFATASEKSCLAVNDQEAMLWLIFMENIVSWAQKDSAMDILHEIHKLEIIHSLLDLSVTRSPLVCNMTVKILYECLYHPPLSDSSEPWSSTARTVLETITRDRWMDRLPYRPGFCGFGGTRVKFPQDDIPQNGDMVLLRLVSGLVLRCMALNPLHDDLSKVFEVLKDWVRRNWQSYPEDDVGGRWLIQVFLDQDDYLMDAMLLVLDLSLSNQELLHEDLNPHKHFVHFVSSIGHDYHPILDFLISSETCALLYLTRYTKLVISQWQEFVEAHGSSLSISRTMNVLCDLSKAIERLTSRGLFPYNPKPLLALLYKCRDQFVQQYPDICLS